MNNRFSALDGMRGIAALCVVFHHVGQYEQTHSAFTHGYLAVDFFFLLSGFVIAHGYEPALRERTLSLWRYGRLRFARLYPTIAIGTILCAAALFRFGGDLEFPLAPALALQLACIPLITAPLLYLVNPVQWSLLYEYAANIAHALVAPFLSNGVLALVIALSGAMLGWTLMKFGHVSVGWGGDTFLYGFPRAVFPFFLGVAMRRAYTHTQTMRLPHWSAPAAGLLLALALAWPPQDGAAYMIRDGASVFLLFPLIVFIGAHARPAPLWRPAATFLGQSSYPLYAFHGAFLLLASATIAAPSLTAPQRWSGWLAAIAVCALFSWAFERSCERPLRRALQGEK